METNAHERLQSELGRLFTLNPELPPRDLQRLYDLADGVGGDHFSTYADTTQQLIEAYLVSAPKQAGQRLLKEYFAFVERAAEKLAREGEIGTGRTEAADQHSVALVDKHMFDSLDYCKIMNQGHFEKPLVKAVDACRQRNDLTSSVLEYMFQILHRIDADRALEWELAFLDRHKGSLDPDIIRDLLRTWQDHPAQDRRPVDWALSWCVDENLLRQWPAVVGEADRFLRGRFLDVWHEHDKGRSSLLNHLRLITRTNKHDTRRLRSWLQSALSGMGESVDFFVTFSPSGNTRADADSNWHQAALMRELQLIESLFTPVLVLSDLILGMPGGASQLARAVFGLEGAGWDAWHHQVLRESEHIVLGFFLRGLREGKPPAETIRTFTFGDELFFQKEMAELDVATQQFGSLKQRDKVVRDLAVFYASYRQSRLVAREITRRYRQLMRMVHEDNLHNLLTEAQFQQVQDLDFLPELSTLASSARRYLNKRDALNQPVEETVATELDFARSVRQRRHDLIRKHLA